MFIYLCAKGIDFASFAILLLDFGTVPTVWDFDVFHIIPDNYVSTSNHIKYTRTSTTH